MSDLQTSRTFRQARPDLTSESRSSALVVPKATTRSAGPTGKFCSSGEVLRAWLPLTSAYGCSESLKRSRSAHRTQSLPHRVCIPYCSSTHVAQINGAARSNSVGQSTTVVRKLCLRGAKVRSGQKPLATLVRPRVATRHLFSPAQWGNENLTVAADVTHSFAPQINPTSCCVFIPSAQTGNRHLQRIQCTCRWDRLDWQATCACALLPWLGWGTGKVWTKLLLSL